MTKTFHQPTEKLFDSVCKKAVDQKVVNTPWWNPSLTYRETNERTCMEIRNTQAPFRF